MLARLQMTLAVGGTLNTNTTIICNACQSLELFSVFAKRKLNPNKLIQLNQDDILYILIIFAHALGFCS